MSANRYQLICVFIRQICFQIPKDQVQKDFERIIRWIGTPAQPPKPRQKAPGRQLGDIQAKRIRHPIVKKWKNSAATEKMIA